MIKTMEAKDSVGNILNAGYTVIISQTLKVKGI
ncbi:PhnA domain-containing protein [Flavobacteriales bacterium]|nr:PhnA domain-containing protein [Flavobacteriales bacterium]